MLEVASCEPKVPVFLTRGITLNVGSEYPKWTLDKSTAVQYVDLFGRSLTVLFTGAQGDSVYPPSGLTGPFHGLKSEKVPNSLQRG